MGATIARGTASGNRSWPSCVASTRGTSGPTPSAPCDGRVKLMRFVRSLGRARLPPSPRSPAEPGEGGAPPRIEAHTLSFEPHALAQRVSGSAPAHRSLRIDDAMPGDGRLAGKRGKSVADHPRMPAEAGDSRHLTIGCHTAGRYATHDGVYARIRRTRGASTVPLVDLRCAATHRSELGRLPSKDRAAARGRVARVARARRARWPGPRQRPSPPPPASPATRCRVRGRFRRSRQRRWRGLSSCRGTCARRRS